MESLGGVVTRQEEDLIEVDKRCGVVTKEEMNVVVVVGASELGLVGESKGEVACTTWSDAAGSSRTVALETKVSKSAPVAKVTGKKSRIEKGIDLGDGDSAPNKAGSISSPTSSLYSRLSSSITSFVEERKSSKETVGASNYLRYLKHFVWRLGPEEGKKLRQQQGRHCLETNREYYKPLLSPIYGYYKQEHKDSKEI
jgi:hypothetical protein